MSGSSDNLKVWKCPEGKFLRNLSGHNSIINSVSVNSDNVLVSGGKETDADNHDHPHDHHHRTFLCR